MRLIIDLDGDERPVDLTRASASATLAELLTMLTGQEPEGEEAVWVDDIRHPSSTLVSEAVLLEGSRIARRRTRPTTPLEGWTASVSGGLNAGKTLPIPTKRPLSAGRSPHSDLPIDSPSASWAHLTIERDGDGLLVRDTGSTNGTRVDGRTAEPEGVRVGSSAVVRVGGATMTLRQDLNEVPTPRPGSLHNQTPAGTVPFNRPPRPGNPAPAEPVVPPVKKDISPTSKFSFLTILGPLVLAAAMVMVMGDFRYAALSALSPLLGVGT